MTNVLTFPAPMPKPEADREQVAAYSKVGTLSVDLIRLPTIMPTLISVAVSGLPVIGLKNVASLPDSDQSRSLADVIGRAVVQALEMADAAQITPLKVS